MSDRPRIQIFDDGPMKVSNAGSMRYCGAPMEAEGNVYLCRCGESAKAPFCDGTHSRVGFVGSSPDAPAQEFRVWEGRTLRTHFNKAACMHVFTCKPLKELREAELAGAEDAATEIMRVIHACPSGALSYEVKDPDRATAPERPAPEVAIDIVEGGEVRVQVPFDLNVPLQERQVEDRATLCRCGRSKNKPWCDGRHKARRDFR